MPGSRKAALWIVVGLSCYVAAAVTFLAVVFGAGILDSDAALESLTVADYLWLLVSVVLFSVGGYAMRRVQRAQIARPDRSSLPPQYRSGPRTARPGSEENTDHADHTDDSGTIRCPNCGSENAPEYTFCQHCSEKLTE